MLSSSEHGDARRALDLLRVGAEIAGTDSEPFNVSHIDMASEKLQQDRIIQLIQNSSYHQRIVCAALARITFLSEEPWHSTSTLYKQYEKLLDSDTKPLSYRRVSDLLIELDNIGLTVSQTGSKGRHGYGTQYKLLVEPEHIGKCFKKWWDSIVASKKYHDYSITPSFGNKYPLTKTLNKMRKRNWDYFVDS